MTDTREHATRFVKYWTTTVRASEPEMRTLLSYNVNYSFGASENMETQFEELNLLTREQTKFQETTTFLARSSVRNIENASAV